MLRSTQSFLKQATKLSGSCPLSASCAPSSNNASLLLARSSSTTSNSASSDYDQIMHRSISNFSSAAGGDSSSPFSTSAATAQVPLGLGVGVAQNATKSNCYRSVHEPTGCEDYDTYELHHPPCERTQVPPYYDDSFDSGGEMGPIIE